MGAKVSPHIELSEVVCSEGCYGVIGANVSSHLEFHKGVLRD